MNAGHRLVISGRTRLLGALIGMGIGFGLLLVIMPSVLNPLLGSRIDVWRGEWAVVRDTLIHILLAMPGGLLGQRSGGKCRITHESEAFSSVAPFRCILN